jgi:5-methylcytosine-specific restriction endonuclease McrA
MTLMQRQCECGNLFWTARSAGYACPPCVKRFKKLRAKETRRIREFQVVGSHTETEWLFQVARQMERCYWCTDELRDVDGRWRGTRDHLTPLAKGGTDNIDNIVAACWPCNRAKGNRTEGEYRAYLLRQASKKSEVSAVPSSMNLEFCTVEMLNPSIQEPFRRLLAIKEAAALVFRGIDPAARLKAQAQKVEILRERKA